MCNRYYAIEIKCSNWKGNGGRRGKKKQKDEERKKKWSQSFCKWGGREGLQGMRVEENGKKTQDTSCTGTDSLAECNHYTCSPVYTCTGPVKIIFLKKQKQKTAKQALLHLTVF